MAHTCYAIFLEARKTQVEVDGPGAVYDASEVLGYGLVCFAIKTELRVRQV